MLEPLVPPVGVSMIHVSGSCTTLVCPHHLKFILLCRLYHSVC